MKPLPRALLGFALAPLPVFLFFLALTSDIGGGLLLSYAPALLFGVPTHFVLRRFGKQRLRHYLIGGIVFPVLVMVVMFGVAIMGSVDSSAPTMVGGLFIGLVITPFAVLTAAMFWLVAVRGAKPAIDNQRMLSATFE